MRYRRFLLISALFAAFSLASCGDGPAPEAADTVLIGGKIITVDEDDNIVEALAISDGKIVATGTNAELGRYIGFETEVIELEGRAVSPGLIDSHNHFAWSATDALFSLDLVYPAVENVADVVALVEDAASRAVDGEWIIGGGWDQGKLAEQRNITKLDLDAVSPNNPVWLGHTSGHYGVANSAALELARVTVETPDIDGGHIERFAAGNPTGILTDNAQELIYEVIPPHSVERFVEAIVTTAPKLNAVGITTIKDPEVSESHWQAYFRAKEAGQLPLRVFTLRRVSDSIESAQELAGQLEGSQFADGDTHDDHLVAGGVKVYIDGSGTVRTAWMHDDWHKQLTTVDEGNTGFPVVDPDVLEQQMRLLHNAGIHMGVHSIGDRAIDFTVDTFDKLLEETPTPGLRHSIIHANIPSDHALDVMARLQSEYDAAYPETQPAFLWWIGDAYAGNFGLERNQRMIPLKTYVDRGIRWGASSDYNVTPFAPRFGLWASVARESLMGTFGEHPFGTDESISVQDALASFTRWNAPQVFMEDKIGSLEVGKYADIVVWDRDPYTVPVEELKEMEVDLTLLGGEIVFDRAASE